ncbi:family 20 glycosylhydrolase [Shewanella maritima]|uniref:family 20 glycosylhydrolase n=1 Tax=Shewanella maritima TaxID=2520507 RepID=UPI003734C6D1
MRVSFAITALVIALGSASCSQSIDKQSSNSAVETVAQWSQSSLNQFADTLSVTYRIVTNVPSEACASDAKADERCFIAEIDLTPADPLTDLVELTNKHWQIYFSQMRPVLDVLTDDFDIERIKGDLHRITPTDSFSGFEAGKTVTLRFRGELWQLSETDPMPNYYIVATDNTELTPAVISSTRLVTDPLTQLEQRPYVEAFTSASKQYQRTATDNLPWATAGVLFEQNAQLSMQKSHLDNSILPTPLKQVTHANQAKADLSLGLDTSKVDFSAVNTSAKQIQAALERLTVLGVSQSAEGIPLVLAALNEADMINGQYKLDVSSQRIMIQANDPSGFSYALASIQSVLGTDSLAIAAMTVEDKPRYDFRGMHIDVGRNFHSKASIFKLIDQMASFKLNKLHLHMADDEGWRLEIDGLPELTDIGSKRCHDLSEQHCLLPQLGSGPFADASVNGYYTKQDYIDILHYADDRQITVIPSMDMPGHSRAAMVAMQARYNRLMAIGEVENANRYVLDDPQDKTVYSSVQYYDDNTLNVCLESTYAFVDKVIDEIAKLHQQAGIPLQTYHIGADETAGAWLESPACQQFVAQSDQINSLAELGPYFIERVANMLADKGIQPAGWSDGMSHTRVENMPGNSQSNAWDVLAHDGYKRIHQQANNGWLTVLSNPEALYFDFPYEADPKEHGYYWAARALNTQKLFSFMTGNLPANAEQWRNIENNPFVADDRVQTNEQGQRVSGPLEKQRSVAGIQGQLWSETIRSPQQLEYMIFPRILMVAERGWHQPEWEVPYQYAGAVYDQNTTNFTDKMRQQQASQWQSIANHIGHKTLAKLDKFAINYRLPTVGAKVQAGQLHTNIAFPGLTVEYRQLEGDWLVYQQPIAVKGSVEVRAVSPNGQRRGRSLTVSH